MSAPLFSGLGLVAPLQARVRGTLPLEIAGISIDSRTIGAGMPAIVQDAWQTLADYPRSPEACLVNYYDAGAKMGLHQDRDEESYVAPVLSLSLGDTCVFRYGGEARRDPTRSVKIESGDALLLSGESRLAFHGVDRIIAGSSTLLAEGGRFNLTIRRITGEPLDERAISSA